MILFQDCLYTRYSLTPGVTPLTDIIKQSFQSKVPPGAGVNAVMVKLFFTSSDYTGSKRFF